MGSRFLTGIVIAFGLLPANALAADCGGKIVRVADGRSVSFDKVMQEIDSAKLVAVGERHGVKEHVNAAACLLQKLNSAGGDKRAVVVEHVAAEKQPIIDAYRKEHPRDAKGLGEALQWGKSGWPAWPVYLPLYGGAFKGGNAVYGADQPKGTPTPALDELAPRLGDQAGQIVSTWGGLMNEAHCNALNEAQAEKFGRAQANRDLAMASVVRSALAHHSRVLFYSGRGHSRKDVSVPLLVNRETGAATVSITLQETHIGKELVKPAEVLAQAKGRYDYVWFIGRAPEEDVCAAFRNKGKDNTPPATK